jgi:hypothetical protein
MSTYDVIFLLKGDSDYPVINVGIADLDSYQWYVKNLYGQSVKPLAAETLLVSQYALKVSELSSPPSEADLLALESLVRSFNPDYTLGVGNGEVLIPRLGLNPLVKVSLLGETIELIPPSPDEVFDYLKSLVAS